MVVAGQFVGVMAAKGVGAVVEPAGQGGGTGGRVAGDKVAGHEAVYLVPGEDHVAERDANHLGGGVDQCGRQVDDERAASRNPPYERDQFFEGKGLGTHGVERHVAVGGGGLNGQLGHIIDENGLHRIVPRTGDRKQREAFQEPGDVIYEDVLAAEDKGGPDDRPGETGVPEVVLHLAFAPEIGQG